MQFCKKITSVLLLCAMLLGMIPTTVFAAEQVSQAGPGNAQMTTADSGRFSELLGQAISPQPSGGSSTPYPYGYNVSGLEFEGNTAKAKLEAAGDALLLVALYTDDCKQLLTSAAVPVSTGDTTAEVTFEGEMPESFYAAAYLVNQRDYTPLCDQYANPMHTKQMRELLESTTKDFSSSSVWNLDEDTKTNFVVFQYNVRRITPTAEKNTLVSMDPESKTYVFENCDKKLTGAYAGGILAYPWQGDMLIIKVASIQKDGTTVTITGGEVQLTEVFEYIKIEARGDTSDVTVESLPGSPFVYVPPVQTYSARATDNREEFENEVLNFEIAKPDDDEEEDEDGGGELGFDISGGVAVTLNGYVDYYLTEYYQFLDVSMGYSAAVNVTFEMKYEDSKPQPMLNADLALLIWSPIPEIVTFSFRPKLEFEWSLSATITGTVSGTIAFQYDSIRGATDHSSDPHFNTSVKLEGTVKVGINWKPSLTIIGSDMANIYILQVNLDCFTGVELTVTATSPRRETDMAGNPTVIHACSTCIAGDFKPVFELTLNLNFLSGWITVPLEILSVDFPSFLTFYMSCLDGVWNMGLGSCPNQAQRVSIQVVEHDNTPAKNVTVTVSGTAMQFGNESQGPAGSGAESWTQTLTTDETGTADIFLYSGIYYFGALDMAVIRQIGDPCRVLICQEEAVALDIVFSGSMTPSDLLDPGVVAFGEAGENVTWVLHGSGALVIQGEGPMYDAYNIPIPWNDYRAYIRTVEVCEGVTHVRNSAFSGCGRLVGAKIADSVITMGDHVFYGCNNLRQVELSANLQSMGDRFFYDCKVLQQVTLPDTLTSIGEYFFYQCSNLESVELPQGITELPQGVFRECASLTRVSLPKGLTTLGEEVFYQCESLKSVVVPEGVTDLPEWTFGYCTALESVILPKDLRTIGDTAFYSCEMLLFCDLPDTVQSLGRQAFAKCYSLQSIVLPEGLTEIPAGCFNSCHKLANVTIPSSITAIRAKAFYDCDNITQAILPEGVTTLEQGVYAYCSNLSQVSLPSTLTTLGGGTTLLEVFPTGPFAGCNNLTSIVIPAGVKELPYEAFYYCKNLSDVVLNEGLETIGKWAFNGCESLGSIVIPASVTTFGSEAFKHTETLHTVWFRGCNPGIDGYTFLSNMPKNKLTVYYPAGDPSWDVSALPKHNGLLFSKGIQWVSWDGGSVAEVAAQPTANVTVSHSEPPSSEDMAPGYSGEFETEFTEEGTLKTVRFTGLVPGAPYLIVNVASLEGELLASDNLLALRQCNAGADGTLQLQFLQREPTDNTYVLAFGMGNRDIATASVTNDSLTADGTPLSPTFRVTLDGRTLVEGLDYTVTGTLMCIEPGSYTCTITGMGSFYGRKTVHYTVADPNATCPFTDVLPGKYYYDAVLWAVREGITTGKTATTFEPDASCTRKQIVTFLWRAAGKPEPASMVNPFTDVKHDSFEKAILWAYYAGITSGTGDGTTFSPENPCTRKQIVTFLWRYNGKPDPASMDNPFTDVKHDSFEKAILWAYGEGITTGKTATTFQPEISCTRCQIVTFLYRAEKG